MSGGKTSQAPEYRFEFVCLGKKPDMKDKTKKTKKTKDTKWCSGCDGNYAYLEGNSWICEGCGWSEEFCDCDENKDEEGSE